MKYAQFGRRMVLAALALAVMLTQTLRAQGPAWTSMGPSPRNDHSAVFDSSTERMIVFGGGVGPSSVSSISQNFNDLWRLNADLSWSPIPAGGDPPLPRSGHSAVYDPTTNSMIVFGGGLGFASPCSNEVWLLTGANDIDGTAAWTQLSPAGTAPAPRLRHTAVYNPNSNTMVVYGGNDCFSTNYGDVWVLTNANGSGGIPTWMQLSPSGVSPGAREDLTAVYDTSSNRLIFFSGISGPADANDVWVLSNADGSTGSPAWVQLSPSGTPPPARHSYGAVYDPSSNLMTIFGGYQQSANRLLRDVWVLADANGIGSPAWTQLGPFTSFPESRSGHTMVYDPIANAMIVFGGSTAVGASAITNNVWVLK